MQGSPGIQKRVKVTPGDGLPVSVCQECTRTPSSMAKRAVEEQNTGAEAGAPSCLRGTN